MGTLCWGGARVVGRAERGLSRREIIARAAMRRMEKEKEAERRTEE